MLSKRCLVNFSENKKVLTAFGLLTLVVFGSVFHVMTAHDTEQAIEPEPSPYVPEGYRFVFGDEFEELGLNEDRWDYRYLHLDSYGAGILSKGAVIQSGDGLLHLVTSHEDGQFLTGMIQSVDEFRYGYFEARIQFQALQGHHGAFWLQSPLYGQYVDDPARSGAEIDIIEFFGNGRTATDAKQNVYWNEYSSTDLQERSNELFYRDQYGEELSEDFHVLSLLWTPDEYVFLIDGVETWRVSEGISQVSQYLVLSLTTSEWENPRLEVGQLPDEIVIDYVRLYHKFDCVNAN